MKKIDSIKSRRDEACLRMQSTASKVAGTALLVCALLLTASSAMANDPPRLIARLTPDGNTEGGFAYDYVCVGDQNGDGYDDILINRDTWRGGVPNHNFLNQIELYYGGPRMDDRPDFIIRGSNTDSIQFGGRINFLGRLTESENPYWAVQTVQETADSYVSYRRVYIFEAGDALDTIPEYILEAESGEGVFIGLGRRSVPCDINGDGFNDLITTRFDDPGVEPNYCLLDIYFGGPNFDSTPDQQITLTTTNIYSYDCTGGYDVTETVVMTSFCATGP